MKNRLDIFERLLDKMKFKEPVPVKLQGAVTSFKVKALIGTLKHFNQYSLFYGTVIRIYTGVRAMGVRISLLQSKMLALILGAAVAGGASAGGYVLVRNLVNGKPAAHDINRSHERSGPGEAVDSDKNERAGKEERSRESAEKDKKNNDPVRKQGKLSTDKTDSPGRKNTEEKKGIPSEDIKNRLGVETFTGEAVDEKSVKSITSLITGELIRLKGKEKVVRIGSSRKKVNLMLIGSVEKLGISFFITAKVVNVESSKVLFTASQSVSGGSGTGKACRELAGRIAQVIK